jgi:hypothetical protein
MHLKSKNDITLKKKNLQLLPVRPGMLFLKISSLSGIAIFFRKRRQDKDLRFAPFVILVIQLPPLL